MYEYDTESERMAAVTENGLAIQHIKNPTEAVHWWSSAHRFSKGDKKNG